MSLTAYPTLRLKLTMPQALKLQFLPAIPGSNAAAAADRAEQAAQDAQDAANAAVAATANKVDKSGDVMTGFLTLNANPTTNLQAATKQYVDAHSGTGGIPEAPIDGTTYGRKNAAWAAVSAVVSDGDKGDITVSGGGATWTIDAGAVSYAKIQNVSVTARFLGRFSASSGVVEEGTGTQATALLDAFTSTLKGLAPASGGGTTTFLRADGSWVAPTGTGTGLSDAFQIIWDGTTNAVAVGAGTFRLRTTAPLTVATQNNDPTFGDNALFALANGTALSVFGVTGNAGAQRADIAGTVGQVLRVSGTTLAFGSIDLSVAATVGTSDLAFANLAQGSARSVLGITGNATADHASIQGTTNQVLRVDGTGTALAFGAIDLSQAATVGTSDLAFANLTQGSARSLLGVAGNATADVASIQGTADQVPVINGAGTALAFGTVATAGITNAAVTYAKMQNISAASLLLGRGSAAGAGSPQEITLGSGLSMSGTVLASTALLSTAQATITNGFRFTPYNGGTMSAAGTYTPDAYNGNYQYYTNNGAHTLAVPANDCAIDIMITNGASAGAITFSGYTVGANVGDTLTNTNTQKFIISIRRINAISTYTVKALQ